MTLKIIGVGTGGNNLVNYMIKSKMKNVEFISVNRTMLSLEKSDASVKISVSPDLGGIGQVMPEEYAKEAENRHDEIAKAIAGADAVFIVSCMGGDVGTGASPVIAKIAKELGIMTISVVTMPFRFEGIRRAKCAEEGVNKLKTFSDEVYALKLDDIKSNKTALEIANIKDGSAIPIIATINSIAKPSLADAFGYADNAICQCIWNIVQKKDKNNKKQQKF